MMKGERALTGVRVLEELQMLQIELEFDSSLRKRLDTLIRIVVQELAMEALTVEKLVWLVLPLMDGKSDAEERVVRARMKITAEDFRVQTRQLGVRLYHKIPLGLVKTAVQIMQTAAAFRQVYEKPEMDDATTQTEWPDFDDSDDDELVQAMQTQSQSQMEHSEMTDQASQDSLEHYFRHEDEQ